MNILICILILVCKMVEDAIATLRLIVVANGKKKLGAILHCINSIVWVFVAATVIINIEKNPIKILFFAFGALLGSYIGSLIEEKIAIGNNVLTVEINSCILEKIEYQLKKAKYNYTCIKSSNVGKFVLLITSSRKKTDAAIKIIRKFDDHATILTEKVKIFNPF